MASARWRFLWITSQCKIRWRVMPGSNRWLFSSITSLSWIFGNFPPRRKDWIWAFSIMTGQLPWTPLKNRAELAWGISSRIYSMMPGWRYLVWWSVTSKKRTSNLLHSWSIVPNSMMFDDRWLPIIGHVMSYLNSIVISYFLCMINGGFVWNVGIWFIWW